MESVRYFQLPVEIGQAIDDAGNTVAWAACPDLPGAYDEAPTAAAARRALHDLARHIIAEHLVRADPLDPAIAETADPTDAPDSLTVAVRESDLETVRNAPLLYIEQPEP